MAEFIMPSLGADMEAGTLAKWCRQPGEWINHGDVIAEIDTDKGLIEVEAFVSGTVDSLLVQPGEKVPVGTVMAIIREVNQEPSPGAKIEEPEPRATQAGVTRVETAVEPPSTGQERLKISPAARKMALELGIDPVQIAGTGPGGRITRDDVELAVKKGASAPQVAEDHFTRMRQAIAASMSRAKREIPHYYLSTTIDLGRALAWMSADNLKRPIEDRLLLAVLLIKATALALRETPELNAIWDGARVVQKEAINVGVAISLRGGGLIAPAVRDADKQAVGELMKALRDLSRRARSGGLRGSELSESTITITNLGDLGVETVFGIIYPPQVALVGFGKVVERPWVVEGQIVVRPVIKASLSADHRASDGHRGGVFLTALDRLLQEPEKL